MPLIGEHLTDDVIERLYFYTQKKVDKLQQSPIKLNLKAKDITHEVICQTLSNKTPWDKKSCPSLFTHLAKNIKSIINQKIMLIEKNKEANDDIEFTSEELQLAFEKFKILVTYLHENKDEIIKNAEDKLLTNKSDIP